MSSLMVVGVVLPPLPGVEASQHVVEDVEAGLPLRAPHNPVLLQHQHLHNVISCTWSLRAYN